LHIQNNTVLSLLSVKKVTFIQIFLGPLYAGAAIRVLGFDWLIWSYVIVLFLFAPALLFLKQPTNMSEERMVRTIKTAYYCRILKANLSWSPT